MKHWMMMVQIPVILCVSALFIGCGQSQQRSANDDLVSVGDGSVIRAECVVNYYRTDKSPYITEQQQAINPDEGFLKIVNREPYGVFEYTLKKNQFVSSQKPKEGLSDLDVDFCDQKLATGIFYSFCAGANLLETGTYATSDNVKVEGRWYQPYQPQWPGENLQVTLLQDIASDRIDLLKIADSKTGTVWLVRSYNLRYNRQLDRLVPRKIDVYDISAGISAKTLIIQFDYKQVQIAGESAHSEENNG